MLCCMQTERQEFVEVMAGNKLLPGMDPAAHCYCGHQFGNFAGQLGDGAVIYLGEVSMLGSIFTGLLEQLAPIITLK